MTRSMTMDEFYAEIMARKPTGWRAFDIGAHRGDKTAEFLSHGAERVLAVEPQPDVFRTLRSRFVDEPRVSLIGMGVGDLMDKRDVEKTMFVCDGADTLSTMNPEWTKTRFRYYGYKRQIQVHMTTLDTLIRGYFIPDYIKIDVEGYEYKVLQGLTSATGISLIAFEWDIEIYPAVKECCDYLDMLLAGRNSNLFEYNFSIGDVWKLEMFKWRTSEEMLDKMMKIHQKSYWGEPFYGMVYARRKG